MEWMSLAIEEAQMGVEAGDGGPFGAVIVRNGELVARGHNCHFKRRDPTAHGEVVAIRAACDKLGSLDLEGCILYTSCFPCPMCYAAAHWARIESIVYATSVEEAEGHGHRFTHAYRLLQLSHLGLARLQRLEHPGRDKPFLAWKAKEDKSTFDFSNF